MMDAAINSRQQNFAQVKELYSQYDRLSNRDKVILEAAVNLFYSVFEKNPKDVVFDFRFVPR